MFYLIYLFSSLILICNYAHSNENPQKVTWACHNENCDTPIADFISTTNYLITDHESKVTFEGNTLGYVYKKPLSGIDYYFVKINEKKGYAHKNYVRLQKKITDNLIEVEEDIPSFLSSQNTEGQKEIHPSKPTVREGTTLYEYDDTVVDSVPLPSNTDVTHPLNPNDNPTNSQDTSESTKSDIVDNINGLSQSNDSSKPESTSTQGTGSISPIDNFNDEEEEKTSNEDVKDKKKKEDLNEVPSPTESTKVFDKEQINDNKSKINSTQDTDVKSNKQPTTSDKNEEVNKDIEINLNDDKANISPETKSTNPDSLSGNTENLPEKIAKRTSPTGLSENAMNTSSDQNTFNTSEGSGSIVKPSHNIIEPSPDHQKHTLKETGTSLDKNETVQFHSPSSQSSDVMEQPNDSNLTVARDSPLNSKTAVIGESDNSQSPTEPPLDQNPVSTESSMDVNLGFYPFNSNPDNKYPIYNREMTSPKQNQIQPSESEEGPENQSYESSSQQQAPDKAQQFPEKVEPDEYVSKAHIESSLEANKAAVLSTNSSPPDSTYTADQNLPGKQSTEGISTPNETILPESADRVEVHSDHNSKSQLSSPESLGSDKKNTESLNKIEAPSDHNVVKAAVPSTNSSPPDSNYTADQNLPGKQSTEGISTFNETILTESADRVEVQPDHNSNSQLSSPESFDSNSLDTQPSDKVEATSDHNSDPPESFDSNSLDAQSVNVDEMTSADSNIQDSVSFNDQLGNFKQNENGQTNDVKTQISDYNIHESSNLYSSSLSFFTSLKELFVKSDLPVGQTISSETEHEDKEVTSDTLTAAPGGYCYDHKPCGGLERPIGGEDQPASFFNTHYRNLISKDGIPLSFNSIMYICITSVVLLLFSLGYYYIEKSQSSSYLVEKVNQLSHELFLTKKERDSLEDQLAKVKENCNMMDSTKIKTDSKLVILQNSFDESEKARVLLEETVIKLEKEIETLMDQGMEMHKLLSDTISDEERSQMLLANIDELKESLSEKLNEIVALTTQLDKKNEEIQLMQLDVRNANDKLCDMDRKLESCKSATEESFSKKLQDHQQQIMKLQQVLEEKGVSVAKLESELAKTKVERDSAEARASSAEAGLQTAHSIGAGEARQAWLDATSVRAALVTASETNDILQRNITHITATNQTLQDKITALNEEMMALNSQYESVEKEKVNALTKLQVLSDYFKQKEIQLQEELGMKESLWLQKESEDHTIYEQMKSLREEISSYRTQNDKLKNEILEQEASYKVQIANEEQKSHDHWFSLRQAERKIKELQMESAHFRNRLTQLENTNNQSLDLNPNGLDKSSIGAPSPPIMMLPPLPHSEFFSMPPPPIHPTASRPPPLGRISSPQLSGEMMPPPPLVSYMLPTSSTPPPSYPLYKPQPRERPPPKDSPPSNYSSESMNDKATRRRRR